MPPKRKTRREVVVDKDNNKSDVKPNDEDDGFTDLTMNRLCKKCKHIHWPKGKCIQKRRSAASANSADLDEHLKIKRYRNDVDKIDEDVDRMSLREPGRGCRSCKIWHSGECLPAIMNKVKEKKPAENDDKLSSLQSIKKAVVQVVDPTSKEADEDEVPAWAMGCLTIEYNLESQQFELDDIIFKMALPISVKDFQAMIEADILDTVRVFTKEHKKLSVSYLLDTQSIGTMFFEIGNHHHRIKMVGAQAAEMSVEHGAGSMDERPTASGLTPASKASRPAPATAPVETPEDAIELGRTIHNMLKTGSAPNIEQALKKENRSRRTLDRFRHIYYLAEINGDCYEKVLTNWRRQGKEQGLGGLDGKCKAIIDTVLAELQQRALDGEISLFNRAEKFEAVDKKPEKKKKRLT